MLLFVCMDGTLRSNASPKAKLLNTFTLKIQFSICEFWRSHSYHTKSFLLLCGLIFFYISQQDIYISNFLFWSLPKWCHIWVLFYCWLCLFICISLILKCCTFLLKAKQNMLGKRDWRKSWLIWGLMLILLSWIGFNACCLWYLFCLPLLCFHFVILPVNSGAFPTTLI